MFWAKAAVLDASKSRAIRLRSSFTDIPSQDDDGSSYRRAVFDFLLLVAARPFFSQALHT
jgi:hypothetical protein